MTRAKDISKIVTDANLSGTLDVTGAVTAGGLTVDGDASLNGTAVNLILNETDTTDLNTRLRQSGALFSISTVNDSGSSPKAHIVVNNSTGDISFYEDTGTTPKLFWDASAESLGIGTSSPSNNLSVVDSSTTGIISLGDSSDSDYIRLVSQSSLGTAKLDTDGELFIDRAGNNLYFRKSGSTQMFINSSGNVGIGTTTAAGGNGKGVAIYQSDYPRLSFRNSSTGDGSSDGVQMYMVSNDYYQFNNEIGSQIFGTSGTERMRIDSSGNVGIGVTSLTQKLEVAGKGVFSTANPDVNGLKITATTGTNASAMTFSNTATAYVGLDNSVGGRISGVPYGLAVWNGSAYPVVFGTNGSERMRITSAGRVGIGINVGTSYHFQVSNSSQSSVVAYFMATSGVGVYLSNGANSWSTASDETLKENINELDKQKSYDNIKNIRAVNYKYIADEDDDTKRIGFIAQDWQTKYPEMIVSDAMDNDKLGLNYTETIPVLLSALQKAQEKIATLETENATQATQITDLISRITALENGE